MARIYQIEDLAYETEEVIRKLGDFISRDGQLQAGRDVALPVVRFIHAQSDPYLRAYNATASAYLALKDLLLEIRQEGQ